MTLSHRPLRIGLALLSLAVLGCGTDQPSRGLSGGGLDDPGPIVLITLSGLRPDAVGAPLGEESWTPNIDAFSREADWVGTTVAASSAPLVSMVSLMTGVSPWRHQVLSHKPSLPRAGIPLLAQAMHRAGYRTEARVPGDYDLGRFGLLNGFREVTEIEPVSDTAQSLQSLGEGPGFYWVYLREANVTYERRDAELPRLAARSAGLPRRITKLQLLPYADPRRPLPAEERSVIWELFRHEVARGDHQVGTLLKALRASGAWERSWVVLTATQGTELGEHGQVLYAQNLGRESIEVPLLIKTPRDQRGSLKVPPGQRVSQLRLWATLVEAAGGQAAPAQAPSLFRAVASPITSELYQRNGVNEFSLLDGDLQLIWATRFAPEEPHFYAAQLAASGGRPVASEPAPRILGRLARAFRKTPPLSGPIGGAPPTLRLERWTEEGTVPVEDRARAEELASELRRSWRLFVDKERTPEEESTLSGRPR